MEHLLVPYTIALAAKKKGFDEPCLYYYDSFKDVCSSSSGWTNYNKSPLLVSRPFHQQLIDWFREKHNLEIKPYKFYFNDSSQDTHTYEINYNQFSYNHHLGSKLSYYKALNMALRHAFKLIKK